MFLLNAQRQNPALTFYTLFKVLVGILPAQGSGEEGGVIITFNSILQKKASS